jgi:hypothetical protein
MSPTKKKAKAEPKQPKGELVTEILPFELTQEEIAAMGSNAGDQSAALTELKAEFKAVRSDFKGKIDTLQSELDLNLGCIKKGTEDREVQCTKVHVKSSDTVQFWYDGEMLKERPATDLDRQKAMPFLRKKKEEPQFNGMVIDHKMAAAGDDSVDEL